MPLPQPPDSRHTPRAPTFFVFVTFLLFGELHGEDTSGTLQPRYADPTLIKRMYGEKANAALAPKVCENHRNPRTKDVELLDYLNVAPPQPWPQLLCASYTYEPAHATKAKTIASTWMSRCDGALILSNATDKSVPAIAIPHAGKETYNNIWQKTRANWKFIHDNYIDDYDYFVFGGDDYYLVVDNLREYLASYEIRNISERGVPLYLGRRFMMQGNVDDIYNSGGPSYILNRQALKILYAHFEKPCCKPNMAQFYEDLLIARCLRCVHPPVHAYDTRDAKGRERFLPFTPGAHLTYKVQNMTKLKRKHKKAPDWYHQYSIDLKPGFDCCSPQSIGYHFVPPALMVQMDALLYGCRKKP